MKPNIITRNDLIRIIARPLTTDETILKKIELRFLRMNEFDFLKYSDTIIPGRINRLSKNRYYIS